MEIVYYFISLLFNIAGRNCCRDYLVSY